MTGARFSHSDIHGSTFAWQLPVAYRSLQRPSSASSAKASTLCPSTLAETMLALAMQFSTSHNPNAANAGACPDPTTRTVHQRRPRPERHHTQTAVPRPSKLHSVSQTTRTAAATGHTPPPDTKVPDNGEAPRTTTTTQSADEPVIHRVRRPQPARPPPDSLERR